MATYTLFTASYGVDHANARVRILEQATGLPAIVMASATGGLLSSNGNALLDASGNLSVYLDSAKTFQVYSNQFVLVSNKINLATEVSRTSSQLAATPTVSDIAMGDGATFFLDTDPTRQYRISLDKQSYSPISGSGGGGGNWGSITGTLTSQADLATALNNKAGLNSTQVTQQGAGATTALLNTAKTGFKDPAGGSDIAFPVLSSVTPQPLGVAAPGTLGQSADAAHVHAMPSAAQVNALGLPLNWNANTNSPALTSSVSPTNNNAYVVTVAGSTTLDGINTWAVGDIAYFSSSGTWQRIAAPPQTGTSLVRSDGAGGFVAAIPGVDYNPAPVMQTGVPIGIAPSGTMGNNGNVVFGVNMPAAYTGIWLYFVAGALYSGSVAGFYWCSSIAASVTNFQVYTATFTASTSGMGAVGTWDIPASPVAVTGTGPGAYSGATSAVFVPGVQIPAGYMGKNGAITAKLVARNNTTATTKTYQACLGSSSTFVAINSIAGSSTAQYAQQATLYNRGVANSQVIPGAQDSTVFGLSTSSIDTTAIQYVQLRLLLAVATDTMVIESVQIQVVPRP